MRRLKIMTAVAVLTILPVPASAVVYNFRSTERSALNPSLTFDFALDTATALTSGVDTVFGNVTVYQNNAPVPGNTVAASFGSNIATSLFFLVDTDNTPFYNGTGTAIRFNTGSFVIADGFTDGVGTLTIADASAAVPEVSTWISLFTGLAMVGGVFRRMRKARYRWA